MRFFYLALQVAFILGVALFACLMIKLSFASPDDIAVTKPYIVGGRDSIRWNEKTSAMEYFSDMKEVAGKYRAYDFAAGRKLPRGDGSYYPDPFVLGADGEADYFISAADAVNERKFSEWLEQVRGVLAGLEYVGLVSDPACGFFKSGGHVKSFLWAAHDKPIYFDIPKGLIPAAGKAAGESVSKGRLAVRLDWLNEKEAAFAMPSSDERIIVKKKKPEGSLEADIAR